MSSNEPLRVRVPGDKSITHRALLLAAVAQGESCIRGGLAAHDTESTRRVLGQLGVRTGRGRDGEVLVAGRGLRGLTSPAAPLDCGNSGTTARLLLGLLAAQPVVARLTGDASLRGRPMRRVTTPLRQMGARIRELEAADRLPVEIAGGPLQGLAYSSPAASAQVKSALLLAGVTGEVPVAFTEPHRSRDHTERLLRGLGAGVSESEGPAGHTVQFQPAGELPPLDLDVPGDFSAAAFLVAAGLLLRRELLIVEVGLNQTRTGLLRVLRRMGAQVHVLEIRDRSGEPVGDVLVTPGPLHGTTVAPAEIPGLIDEVPVLAVLAAVAEGETRITGAGELRVKESDRIATLVANLRAVGAAAEELPDGLVVNGRTDALAGSVDPAGDHRIAMAFGVLGAVPGNRVTVLDRGAAAVSYPAFWEQLEALGPRP